MHQRLAEVMNFVEQKRRELIVGVGDRQYQGAGGVRPRVLGSVPGDQDPCHLRGRQMGADELLD